MDRRKHNVVVVVSERGGPEVLKVVRRPLPQPGPGEVRLEVHAAGISAYDAMNRRRRFPGSPKPPFVPGEDVVGIVDKLGEGVTGVEVGDRVAAWTFGNMGGYAESICVPAEHVVPVPEGLDSAEAVALVVNYLTAHLALHETVAARRGESILIHGAAGGVGSALVQLGGLLGLEMYGTASAHNQELVSELGATPIDYRNEDFVARIYELTGDGVDIVVDVIGGGRQLRRSYKALNKGGRLVMLGMASATHGGLRVVPPSLLVIALVKLLPNGRSAPLTPTMADYPQEHLDWYRNTLAGFFDLAVAGKMKPLIAERVPLSEANHAHELLDRGGYAGKFVLATEAGRS